MTAERRSALADLLERETEGMTPGEWFVSGRPWFMEGHPIYAGSDDPHVGRFVADGWDAGNDGYDDAQDAANARAIVALGNHLPDILRELREGAARVERLRNALFWIAAHDGRLTAGDAADFWRVASKALSVDDAALRATVPPAHEGTE